LGAAISFGVMLLVAVRQPHAPGDPTDQKRLSRVSAYGQFSLPIPARYERRRATRFRFHSPAEFEADVAVVIRHGVRVVKLLPLRLAGLGARNAGLDRVAGLSRIY